MLQRFKAAWKAFTSKPDPLADVPIGALVSLSDDPQLRDYPKGAYWAYWETVYQEIDGGHLAIVRFYNFSNAPREVREEHQFVSPRLYELKKQVGAFIKQKMTEFAR